MRVEERGREKRRGEGRRGEESIEERRGEGRGGVVCYIPRAHRIHFSQCTDAGGKARVSERGRSRGARVCVCVRVCVSARGLHHRIPFTVMQAAVI